MLTPKYLEALPQPMIQLYSRLENEILEDIAKRITAADYLTPTAEWRLYKAEQLRLSSKEITAKLARLTGKSEKEIRKLYTAALKEALKNDEKIYRAAINEGYLSEDQNGVLNSYFGSVAFSNALKAGLQNTNGLMRNLCNSAAASANNLLSDELDLAFLKVTSGAFTMDEAVFSAVKNLGKSGLTVVNYASGRKDKVDVAVRRAVLTGIGQATANVQLGLAADMGCDLVEVTAHLGARPTHQLFQGKIFSLSGKHPKYPAFRPSTGYGTGDGLCGWNCRHSFYPYFEGLSKPVGVPFTKEENDKVYRDTQKQRAYERAIRQSKRELAALDASRSAASDDALKQKLDREFQRKAVVLKRREAKLSEHLKASGLLPDNSRVRVDGFGRSVSGKAVWAAKKQLQSPEKYVKINAGDYTEKFGKTAPESYFDSDEYKSKFYKLGENMLISNLIYKAARNAILENYGKMAETGRFVDRIFFKLTSPKRNKALEVNLKIPASIAKNQYILVHNHPNNTPLSFTDILTLNENPEIKTIIAASHDGKVYWLQIGNGKRLDITNKMLADGDIEARLIKNDWDRSVRDNGMLSALEMFINDYGWKGGVL